MTFGQKLQQLRRARGLSQEDLAQQLSVTRQTISKWELDQSTPDLPYLAAISEFFGVSTDYLIKETSSAEETTCGVAPSACIDTPTSKFKLFFLMILSGLIGYLMAREGIGFVLALICIVVFYGAVILIYTAWGTQIKSALADAPAFRKEDDQ